MVTETSDAEIQEYLEDWVRATVLYIERYHSVSGVIPPDSDILEYLRITLKFGISDEQFRSLKFNKLFIKSLEVRGLYINQGHGELRLVTGLNQRQMEAASLIQNYMDRRSDEKKLRDLGISTDEWATWMLDNTFVAYLNQRMELLISNSQSEAHMGLLRGVRQGNVSSIKYYNELTGRYNPNDENQVNIRLLISKVLEAIQKHVGDQETLNNLAIELSKITLEAGGDFPVGAVKRSAIGSTNNKEFEV